MELKSNPQLELAHAYVTDTDRNIFLTGKAGTGKTTFLHQIKKESVKRSAVVAPTGVAAINAGGMTIHSLFQLPFGPWLPGKAREAARQRRFSAQKIKLIRSLDLLIIDEISMVRADLLDAIDDVLRRYKNPIQPFGGVQLLMIGDLHQLPPVVKDEEWDMLREIYATPYFFNSKALRESRPVVIELKKVYRQSDHTFISLLNRVRDNEVDDEVLSILNSRFKADFQPGEKEGYITLTTHNASANRINRRKLEAITDSVHRFSAIISGDFPAHAYPTEEKLELKVGAQVMFVKNDPSFEKRYYNGKIGRIVRIDEEEIRVLCPEEEEAIKVGRVDWENVKYTLNEATKEVSEETVGTFSQYPLKLAWAITIHKSQGLTFERVVLDAEAAFAHGQVYVALSRCKSFDGIVLHSRITTSSVKTDAIVRDFSLAAEKNAPDEAHLEQARVAYQRSLILDLFEFKKMKDLLKRMNRVLLEYENSLQPGAWRPFNSLLIEMESNIFPVAEKFRGQLRRLTRKAGNPEQNEMLQERIRKGSTWFFEKINDVVMPLAGKLHLVSDNKKVRKLAAEALENLKRELAVKRACFSTGREGFSSREFLRVKADAELDFQAKKSRKTIADATAPLDTPHPALYKKLLDWRNATAESRGVPPYTVLPTRSILELAGLLPLSKAGLKKITGIGKGRIRQFGAALLSIIQDYCTEHQVASPIEETLHQQKAPRPDTKMVTFVLFQSGKSIEEIANARNLKPSTIEGHLAHFISQGELSVFDLIKEKDVRKIEQFFSSNPEALLSESKTHFGDAYSYGEIKMVMAHLNKD